MQATSQAFYVFLSRLFLLAYLRALLRQGIKNIKACHGMAKITTQPHSDNAHQSSLLDRSPCFTISQVRESLSQPVLVAPQSNLEQLGEEGVNHFLLGCICNPLHVNCGESPQGPASELGPRSMPPWRTYGLRLKQDVSFVVPFTADAYERRHGSLAARSRPP